MYMEYHFTEACYVKISLENDSRYSTPNYIWITMSNELIRFLKANNHTLSVTPLGISEEDLRIFKKNLYEIFEDSCSVVYIPAGRSMITLLSQQLSYIYATMDDMQKRSLDTCTKDYLERILRLKPEFSEGLQGLAYSSGRSGLSPRLVVQALDLTQKILRGTYRYSNGEEQIVLEDGKYVKINFSSSGQQECVWILNLLFYYLVQQKEILFIIEEKAKVVISIEEHAPFGGLGSMVSQVVGAECPRKVVYMSLPDAPVITGTSKEVFDYYGLNAEGIAKKAKELLA